MESVFFSLFGFFISRKQASWFWQHRQQTPNETWADFKRAFICAHWKLFWKFVRTSLSNTYVEETSVQEYAKHKMDNLKLIFPSMDEQTLMTIAVALLPDKFDTQLQEGVSMGGSQMNTMAYVIDKSLGFHSSSDEEEEEIQVLNSSSKPIRTEASKTANVDPTLV